MNHLPRLIVPRVAENWDANIDPFTWVWEAAVTLPPLILADGSQPALQQTVTHVCYNGQALFVRFDCADRDIWGTYTQRDEAIYDEEVVEIFLAPGEATPINYYELEISPNGVLLDVLAYNPTGDRAQLALDFSWDCPGLRSAAPMEAQGRAKTACHWFWAS